MNAKQRQASSHANCKKTATWVMLAFTMHVMAGCKYDFDGKIMGRNNLCKPGLLGKAHAKIFVRMQTGS